MVGIDPPKDPITPPEIHDEIILRDHIKLKKLHIKFEKMSTVSALLTVSGIVVNTFRLPSVGKIKIRFEERNHPIEETISRTLFPGAEVPFKVQLTVPIHKGILEGELTVEVYPFVYSVEPKVLFTKKYTYTIEMLETPEEEEFIYTDSYTEILEDADITEKKVDWKKIVLLGVGAIALMYILRKR